MGSVPAYRRIYEDIAGRIRSGDLAPEARVLGVSILAEQYGVARMTVRQAIAQLVEENLVVRQQGVGTFVAPRRLVSEPNRPGSLLETISGTDGELPLTTELVSMLVGMPSEKQATALGIESGQPVWEISRLRRLGAAPKVLEKAVLPLHLVPTLDEERLTEGDSLYAQLADRYGLTDDFVEQTFEVDHPSSWEREHLRLDSRDTVVRIRGVSVDGAGVPFDSFQQTYPATEFVFYVSGGSRKLLEPTEGGSWAIRPLGTPKG